jgi:hypothetical protein
MPQSSEDVVVYFSSSLAAGLHWVVLGIVAVRVLKFQNIL